jgi:hypothetical protein
MYGWYSEKQKKVIQQQFDNCNRKNNQILYLNEKDEIVEVTEVSQSKKYSSTFDDVVYIGPLKSYYCVKPSTS